MKTLLFVAFCLFSICIFADTIPPLPHDTVHYVITSQQLASDTVLIKTIGTIVMQFLPPKWAAVCGLLIGLLIFVLVILSHCDVKLFKRAAILLLLISLGFGMTNAQTISNERTNKYYAKHPSKAILLGQEGVTAPATTSGYIISLEPSFGLNALTVQKGPSGWASSGSINPSFTYGLSFGEYTQSINNMQVANYFTLGAGLAAGVIPSSVISGSFQTYGFATIYNYATIGAGYDVATRKPFFGIGASVPFFTFKQGLGSYILKLF